MYWSSRASSLSPFPQWSAWGGAGGSVTSTMSIAPQESPEAVAPSATATLTVSCVTTSVSVNEMIPNLAALASAARQDGATVVHGLAERRADGKGASSNTRLFQYAARSAVQLTPGSPAVAVIPEIGVADGDIVLSRLHGLSPFAGTELDAILRNEGVRTVVAAGVSVNVAVQNLTFDAVNAAYQVVIPKDAVAGFPADYVEAVFANTLGAVATLMTTNQILEIWQR